MLLEELYFLLPFPQSTDVPLPSPPTTGSKGEEDWLNRRQARRRRRRRAFITQAAHGSPNPGKDEATASPFHEAPEYFSILTRHDKPLSRHRAQAVAAMRGAMGGRPTRPRDLPEGDVDVSDEEDESAIEGVEKRADISAAEAAKLEETQRRLEFCREHSRKKKSGRRFQGLAALGAAAVAFPKEGDRMTTPFAGSPAAEKVAKEIEEGSACVGGAARRQRLLEENASSSGQRRHRHMLHLESVEPSDANGVDGEGNVDIYMGGSRRQQYNVESDGAQFFQGDGRGEEKMSTGEGSVKNEAPNDLSASNAKEDVEVDLKSVEMKGGLLGVSNGEGLRGSGCVSGSGGVGGPGGLGEEAGGLPGRNEKGAKGTERQRNSSSASWLSRPSFRTMSQRLQRMWNKGSNDALFESSRNKGMWRINLEQSEPLNILMNPDMEEALKVSEHCWRRGRGSTGRGGRRLIKEGVGLFV